MCEYDFVYLCVNVITILLIWWWYLSLSLECLKFEYAKSQSFSNKRQFYFLKFHWKNICILKIYKNYIHFSYILCYVCDIFNFLSIKTISFDNFLVFYFSMFFLCYIVRWIYWKTWFTCDWYSDRENMTWLRCILHRASRDNIPRQSKVLWLFF